MATDEALWSDLPVPPGRLIAETLALKGLTQADLARRMRRPAPAINEIVHGRKAITAETAIQLERALGVPAHLWLGLEVEYRHARARRGERERLATQAPLLARFPYSAMARPGWLPNARQAAEKVSHLLGFFGVSSLEGVAQAEAVAYRLSRSHRAEPEALAAWLRKGELEARKATTGPFDDKALRAPLHALRQMTTLPSHQIEPWLRRALAGCGVALVLLPHLPKTHAHGATKWIAPDKALLIATIRGRYADIFWFSIFHEIGHLLLHGRKAVFVEWADRQADGREREADEFAADQLIPKAAYERFVESSAPITAGRVRTFARQVGIAPGVVVGRLQHDRRIPYSALNALREPLAVAAAFASSARL
jgi:HTH-type transcriptional regulator/antitoxin HigA